MTGRHRHFFAALTLACPLSGKCWPRITEDLNCRRCGACLIPKTYDWVHPRGHLVGSARQRRVMARYACRVLRLPQYSGMGLLRLRRRQGLGGGLKHVV